MAARRKPGCSVETLNLQTLRRTRWFFQQQQHVESSGSPQRASATPRWLVYLSFVVEGSKEEAWAAAICLPGIRRLAHPRGCFH